MVSNIFFQKFVFLIVYKKILKILKSPPLIANTCACEGRDNPIVSCFIWFRILIIYLSYFRPPLSQKRGERVQRSKAGVWIDFSMFFSYFKPKKVYGKPMTNSMKYPDITLRNDKSGKTLIECEPLINEEKQQRQWWK